jgi:hypothetical protein
LNTAAIYRFGPDFKRSFGDSRRNDAAMAFCLDEKKPAGFRPAGQIKRSI